MIIAVRRPFRGDKILGSIVAYRRDRGKVFVHERFADGQERHRIIAGASRVDVLHHTSTLK